MRNPRRFVLDRADLEPGITVEDPGEQHRPHRIPHPRQQTLPRLPPLGENGVLGVNKVHLLQPMRNPRRFVLERPEAVISVESVVNSFAGTPKRGVEMCNNKG
jgi:hypothetical protein